MKDERVTDAILDFLRTVKLIIGELRVCIDAIDILKDLYDEEPCSLDHSGHCQAHLWFDDRVACPHKRIRELVERFEVEKRKLQREKQRDEL